MRQEAVHSAMTMSTLFVQFFYYSGPSFAYLSQGQRNAWAGEANAQPISVIEKATRCHFVTIAISAISYSNSDTTLNLVTELYISHARIQLYSSLHPRMDVCACIYVHVSLV